MQNEPAAEGQDEIQIDLIFQTRGPTFGDLFLICGYPNPAFPPEGRMDFLQFEPLLFSQVDDYFGVRTTSGIGDDVAIWLFPLVDGAVVDHHPGPYDGLRLSYSILRNPADRSAHFVHVVEELTRNLPVTPHADLDLTSLQDEITKAVAIWTKQGIKVGSRAALLVGAPPGTD